MTTPQALPGRSPRLFRLFRRYAKRYVARHFHAVRVSRNGPIPELPRRPAIVAMNHPSWWDPLIGLILTDYLPDWRTHFAPIDTHGLAQYRFLARLGFFGIEPDTPRGGLAFLRACQSILKASESMIWITAQGTFIDPRERPIALKEGIGHLAHRRSGIMIIPLAVEYPFWNDRCPEALVRFGPIIDVDAGKSLSPAAWTAAITAALQDTQDQLALDARRRDPDVFETLLQGTSGIGGVYDKWRRLIATVTRQPFRAEHSDRPAVARREEAEIRTKTTPRTR